VVKQPKAGAYRVPWRDRLGECLRHEDAMNKKATFLVGGLAVMALGLGATFGVAQYRMGVGGGARGGMGFHLGMFCGDGSRADHVLDRLERRLQPTDAQKAVFADFKAAAKTAGEKVKGACPIERTRNLPERLAMAEKRAEAALDALRILRPAADKLYAALSDEQKATINGLRRRWGWSHAQSEHPTP
jgi:LTXXQ motif family protein